MYFIKTDRIKDMNHCNDIQGGKNRMDSPTFKSSDYNFIWIASI